MQYDKNRFTVWKLPHPNVLFWVLFPGMMLNELTLGQRLPKVMLIDEKSDKPFMERTYVPCPHCETLNDGRLWSKRNAFGHWFGLVCPSCYQIIPCLWNIFSLAILAITFPMWYLPVRFFRHRWIEIEKKRFAKGLERPLIQAKSINWLWLLIGIFGWGVPTWATFEVLMVLHYGQEWDLKRMLVGLPIWLVGGFVWGLWMRFYANRKGKKANRQVSDRRGRFGGFVWGSWERSYMNRKGEKADAHESDRRSH